MRSMRGAQLQWSAVRFAVALVIVCVLSIATAGSSHAQVPAVQAEVVGGGPVFDIDNLYPGASTDSTVRGTHLRADPGNLDRKSVVWGTRVAVRVGLGCRRLLNNKHKSRTPR